MSVIADNIIKIKKNIAITAEKSGRNPNDITLICVTKFIQVEDILDAVFAGIDIMGESRVEEAVGKKDKIPLNVKMHMIGHLQTRKVKDAVKIFDLIHSVDSVSLADEIDKRAGNIGKIQKILLEVNVSGEAAKYGFKPGEILQRLREISVLHNLKVLGLMTMAPLVEDIELTRPVFRGLKKIFENIRNTNIPNIEIKYLSMGMSQDYTVAIEEGSNMVRIGTAIFGEEKN